MNHQAKKLEEKDKLIEELEEALSVCKRDYFSMIRLLKGIDNLCAIECVNRMEMRKPLFEKTLAKLGEKGEE